MTREATQLGTGNPPVGDETLPKPGDLFDGKYRIESEIGRGAMAVVFKATHLQLEDGVAIKLLLSQWAARPDLVDRFMREGRAATRIRSEHVVRVFDVGVVGDHPYLVMEYLDGLDLDQVLEKDGPLPVSQAVDYLLQAGEAIAEAHANGIVHRDLKPANLFLTRRADGSACVKVLDFGISKAATAANPPDTRTTEPAAVMGSPHYMSPEQMLSSTDVDARADVWAMGAILHELLAGIPAFNAESIAALSAAILRDPPAKLTGLRADVPRSLEEIVVRCLEKEPGKRFANVADLAAALAPYGGSSSTASAERIARVLGAGNAKTSFATVSPPELRALERPTASLLVAEAPRPRGSHRMLGYVVAAVAVLGIGGWIVAEVVKDEHAAEMAIDAGPPASPVLTSGTSTAAGMADAAPVAAAEAKPTLPTPAPADVPPNEHSGHKVEPPHTPVHARGPHRGGHGGGSKAPPPLPDFPVPNGGAEEDPSSRPIQPAAPEAPPVPASSASSEPPAAASPLTTLPAPSASTPPP